MVHKITGAGATAENEFTEGNPGTGTPATVVTDDWMNMVQRELIALAVAAGITPTLGDDDQLLEAFTVLGLPLVLKNGNSKFSLPLNTGFGRMQRLDAGAAVLEVLSGSADSLASLRLREPGVSRAWQLSAGAALKELQFGFDPDGSGFGTKMTLDDAGNLRLLGHFSLGQSGWCRLTNGLLLQWGRYTTAINPADASVTLNFPLAFPTAVHHALACPRNNVPNANNGAWADVQALTLTQLTVYANYGGAGTSQLNGFFWIALGE
jgi:hypothetical protein